MVCETGRYEPSMNGISKNNLKNERQIKGMILNEKQMRFLAIKPYMYNCYVGSILENLFLQRFWYYLSHYVPLWIAPCTLTCVGLLINVITCAILIWYSPDARQTSPGWPFLLCAIGLFVYQVFDALDGKQAVIVQDTPIEEVYDHGCDAISALFVTQSVTIATRLGDYPFMQIVFFLLPLIAFYMTHYSCHVTHVMHFGRVDVIEGQWSMIAIHVLTYIYGQQIWETTLITVMNTNIRVTHILFTLSVLALMLSIINNTLLICGTDSPMDKYIRIPRKNDKSKWNPVYCLLILIICVLIGYERQVFQTNSILFIFVFGLSFAKLSFKLQIMNVSHENMSKLDSCIAGPIFLALNSYLKMISLNGSLVVTLFFALLDHCFYFVGVSLDMKKALDVNIFSLKYPIGHKKCRNKNYGFNLNGTENAKAINNIQKYNKLLDSVYI